MQNDSLGIIYVLTNPAMPGLVKIGKTTRESVYARLTELYSTGVPVPFECAFAGRIADEARVEKAFHLAFGPYRVNPRREFFTIEPESRESSRKLKARRPVQNFLEMGIPAGAEILFSDGETTCRILNGRRVEYQGEEYSLTALTQNLLETKTPLQPGPRWTYKGKSLARIYDETYGEP